MLSVATLLLAVAALLASVIPARRAAGWSRWWHCGTSNRLASHRSPSPNRELLGPQGLYWIRGRSATSRNKAGQQCCNQQEKSRRAENREVHRADTIQQCSA